MQLAVTPHETDTDYMRQVLTARLNVSELSLEASQAAMLHAGARGYIHGSAFNRRLRESYFVAIVTPSIKHLQQELARLAVH
jgi:alkylation response protein AidB-like acyl-CoA dehydrogenase